MVITIIKWWLGLSLATAILYFFVRYIVTTFCERMDKYE